MSKRPRWNYSPAFKAKVALAAAQGEKTLSELAQQYDVHPNLTDQWRGRLLEGAADMFGAELTPTEPAVDVTGLHATIGELTLPNDFFGRCAREAGLLPSARRWSTGIMRCRWSPKRGSSASTAAASTICRPACQTPTWRSCGGSTSFTLSTRLPTAGCCVTCSGRKGWRWVGCMSRR